MNEIVIRIIWAAALGIISGVLIYFFMKLPVGTQKQKIQEWLLWAVTEAEKELGGGTGQIKLRQVYNLFIERFKFISTLISFETFSKWVDIALEKMRTMLKSNKAVQELIEGKDDKEV